MGRRFPGHGYRQVSAYPNAAESKRLLRPSREGGFLRSAWRNGWSLPGLIGVIDFLLLYLPAVREQWVRLGWLTLLTFVLLAAFALTGVKGQNLSGPRVLATAGRLALCHLPFHLARRCCWPGRDGPGSGWPGAVRQPPVGVRPARRAGHARSGHLHPALPTCAAIHRLEAFSGMRIEDYKCHLRLQISADRVTVHVVAIDRVPAVPDGSSSQAPPLTARVVRRFTVAHSPARG